MKLIKEENELIKKTHFINGRSITLLLAILFLATLSACGNYDTSKEKVPPTATQVNEQPTATLEVLGSEQNPFVMGLVLNEGQEDADTGEDLIDKFFESTGSHLEIRYYPDYASLLLDMRIGAAHIAWLPPATYIFLHELGAADVSLLSNHFGVYMLGSQIVANKDSGFTSFFDPATGKNTADISRALAQFEDQRPCWVSVNSLSGYLVPLGLFIQNDIPLLDGVYTQNHTSVIRTLYIRGVCDFGATFALSGDPRTSSAVLEDLTDAMEQVIVVYRTDGIIPNNNLSYSPIIPPDIRRDLDAFFLEQARTDEGRTLLSSLTNYEINGLMKVDDSIYNQLRELLTLTGVDLSTLIGW